MIDFMSIIGFLMLGITIFFFKEKPDEANEQDHAPEAGDVEEQGLL